ncbi:hypothetical protein [Cellulomonas xiejunii]|uniref:AprE-like beta-barrel domain-containing protein n=1 Tax=Cellulomonas xiejunii TaxID=2968083 RepID=A0ABY5KTB4_9CELL|nr:hypothetical protein [Cellulomonas xiejunii]UUI72370.1 hypothetical protein NP048_02555 [Cellulomonas xiejunii]
MNHDAFIMEVEMDAIRPVVAEQVAESGGLLSWLDSRVAAGQQLSASEALVWLDLVRGSGTTLASVDAETTPEVWGVVTTVSAAPSVDPSTGETNYVARLSVDDDAPGSLREAFVAGMPVEAQLQMGRRTVLSYLLKPMSDQLARALKEE